MNKKIIHNIFQYAAQEEVDSFIINNDREKLYIDYIFPDERKETYVLPKKVADQLLSSLYHILNLKENDIIQNEYKKINHKNYQLKFNINIIPQSKKIVIKVIKKDNKLLKLKQLGLQRSELKTIKKALKYKSGLILISSPKRQGKNATLCALLDHINTEDKNIYFLEKDFPNTLTGINSLQDNTNNWHKILQSDSDVIVYHNIKNNKDLEKVLYAANTGRLVLASIEGKSVWEVLLKILRSPFPLHFKIEPLKLIINQRIVNTNSPRHPEIGIFETLLLNSSLKDYIYNPKNKNKFWQNLASLAIKNGFHPLKKDLEQKKKDGLIDNK